MGHPKRVSAVASSLDHSRERLLHSGDIEYSCLHRFVLTNHSELLAVLTVNGSQVPAKFGVVG